MENLSHAFFASKWFVHNRFVDLGNPFEVVVHHFFVENPRSFYSHTLYYIGACKLIYASKSYAIKAKIKILTF